MKCRSHLEFPEYWSCRVLVEPPLTCSAIAMGVFWLARVPPNWPQPQSLATLLAPQRAALSNLWWVANSLTTAHSRPRFSVFGRTSISLCSTVPTTQMSLCSTTLKCTQIVFTGGCASIFFPKMQGVLVAVVLGMQLLQSLQCLAGYYHIKDGHLFDTNYK